MAQLYLSHLFACAWPVPGPLEELRFQPECASVLLGICSRYARRRLFGECSVTHVSQISPAPDSMMPGAALADRLKTLLGAGNVVQDSSGRAFFSGDIFTQGIVAELLVSPHGLVNPGSLGLQ